MQLPKFYEAFKPTLQILADSGPLQYNDLRIKVRDVGQKITIIDGDMLVDLMYRYGVGEPVKNSYEVKE